MLSVYIFSLVLGGSFLLVSVLGDVFDADVDVDGSIGGIEVSDATLGAVKLDWNDFDRVDFHGTDDEVAAANFDGGHLIHGTVETLGGERYTGDITWDRDEQYSWEMLNGDIRGVSFHIEFGNVERITPTNRGADVTLFDGRTFHLSGSNDVDDGNRGLLIRTDGREFEIDWDNLSEVTFTR